MTRYLCIIFVLLTSSANANLCKKYISRYEQEYNLPINLLMAVAIQESGKFNRHTQQKEPYPWAVNVHGKGYYLDSKYELSSIVKQLNKHGVRSIDVGCMQINLRYHIHNFNSISDAIHPQNNIRYAAQLLRKYYDKYGNWKQAIANYHIGGNSNMHSRGVLYAKKVLKLWNNEINNLIAKHGTEIMYPNTNFVTIAYKPERVQ